MDADAGGRLPGPLPAGRSRPVLVAEVADVLEGIPAGARVLVACSGGPDSTALAFLSADARPDLELVLTHVRHGLRSAAADEADAAVVRQHATWLGAEVVVRSVEVVVRGHGVESAAREARYRALREVAGEQRAAAILVGHTADDQAETVLLRAARGTGLDGLAAMAAVRGDLVRPLLRIRRDDVRHFVALEGLPHTKDPTNADERVRRSLIRHQVLPLLEQVGPDPVGALARLAALARDDARALDEAVAPMRAEVCRFGGVLAVPSRLLRSSPVALARRLVRELMTVEGSPPPDAAVVARVLDPPSDQMTLPGGVRLTVVDDWLILAPSVPSRADPVEFGRPGSAPWPPAGLLLRAVVPAEAAQVASDPQPSLELEGTWLPPRPPPDPRIVPPGAHGERMSLPIPGRLGPLLVRHRRPGDRIATQAGTKRVARVQIESGLPRPLRAVWPVVAAGDRVVWIPGLAADREVLAEGRRAPAGLLIAAAEDEPEGMERARR